MFLSLLRSQHGTAAGKSELLGLVHANRIRLCVIMSGSLRGSFDFLFFITHTLITCAVAYMIITCITHVVVRCSSALDWGQAVRTRVLTCGCLNHTDESGSRTNSLWTCHSNFCTHYGPLWINTRPLVDVADIAR